MCPATATVAVIQGGGEEAARIVALLRGKSESMLEWERRFVKDVGEGLEPTPIVMWKLREISERRIG